MTAMTSMPQTSFSEMLLLWFGQTGRTPPPVVLEMLYKCSISVSAAVWTLIGAQPWKDWAWFSSFFSWCSRLRRVSNGWICFATLWSQNKAIYIDNLTCLCCSDISHLKCVTIKRKKKMISFLMEGMIFLSCLSSGDDPEMQYWTCGYRGLCRRFCYAQEYIVGHHGCPRRYR